MTQPRSTLVSLDATLAPGPLPPSPARISAAQPHSALVELFIPPGSWLTDSVIQNRVQA
jgi:hypothetical protein